MLSVILRVAAPARSAAIRSGASRKCRRGSITNTISLSGDRARADAREHVVIEMVARHPRLSVTALQTVSMKGYDGLRCRSIRKLELVVFVGHLRRRRCLSFESSFGSHRRGSWC